MGDKAKLLKVCFGNERRNGLHADYVCAESLLDHAVGLEQGVERIAALADNSVHRALFEYSLEYLGDDSNPQESLLVMMRELYRVCCDGALVEIKVAPSAVRVGDPFVRRQVSAATLGLFDREQRAILAQDERMTIMLSELNKCFAACPDIDFKILRNTLQLSPEFMQQVQQGVFKTPNELQAAIARNPQATTGQTFFLVCHKDAAAAAADKHHYAVVDYKPVPPFVMRIFDTSGTEQQFVSNGIKRFAVWEEHESYLVVSLVQQLLAAKGADGTDGTGSTGSTGSTVQVANIGANLGWFSLLAAHLGPKVRVDAFEPTPQTASLFKASIELNALQEQICLHEVALSNESGSAELFVNKDNAGSNSVQHFAADTKGFDAAQHISIKTETLDQIYKSSESPRPAPELIVMDAEGHEQLILDGGHELFESGWRPVIITEFSPALLALRGECHYYRDLVTKYGYKPYVLTRNNVPRQLMANGLYPVRLNIDVKECAIEYLDQVFAQLRNDPKASHLDLFLVPMDRFVERDGLLLLQLPEQK